MSRIIASDRLNKKFDVVLDLLLKRDRADQDSLVLSMLYDMEKEKTELCIFIPYLERLLEGTDGYRRFLEQVYPVILCCSDYQESESGIYRFIAREYDLQMMMRADVVDGLDKGFRRKYITSRQKYLIRGIERDEGGKMVYDKTNTPRYFTAQDLEDLNEQRGIDVVLPNEIRVAEMYENPVICGKVIRILEDEEFPMKQEYRKACGLLDKLRRKYEKKEPAEDILARFH